MRVGPTGAVLWPPMAQPVPGKNKGRPEEEEAWDGWRPGPWWQLWPWHLRQSLCVPGPLFSHVTLGRGKRDLYKVTGMQGCRGQRGPRTRHRAVVSVTQRLQEEKAGTASPYPRSDLCQGPPCPLPALPPPPKVAQDSCGQFCHIASFLSLPLKKGKIPVVLGLSHQHVIYFSNHNCSVC